MNDLKGLHDADQHLESAIDLLNILIYERQDIGGKIMGFLETSIELEPDPGRPAILTTDAVTLAAIQSMAIAGWNHAMEISRGRREEARQ